jgi:hypothetical protein
MRKYETEKSEGQAEAKVNRQTWEAQVDIMSRLSLWSGQLVTNGGGHIKERMLYGRASVRGFYL